MCACRIMSSSQPVQPICLFCSDTAEKKCHQCASRTCAAHSEIWLGEDNTEQVWCTDCLSICAYCEEPATDVCAICPARMCGACARKCQALHRCDKIKYYPDCAPNALQYCTNCQRPFCQIYVSDCCERALTTQLCERCIRDVVLGCEQPGCHAIGCAKCLVQVCRVCDRYECKKCAYESRHGVGAYIPRTCQLRSCGQPVCLACAGHCTRCGKTYCTDHGTYVCDTKCAQDLCEECLKTPCSPCKKRALQPQQDNLAVMAK